MKKLTLFLVLIVFLFSFSCQTLVPPIPEKVRIEPPPKRTPRVALVLGGGAARGFAHVGVIRILEKEKIPIDMIIGTSVGSLVGAIYASERDSFQLEWIAYKIRGEDIFDLQTIPSSW